MTIYYVFVKENYYRPVKVEANSIESAVDKVATGTGDNGLPIEYHSTSDWTEWIVEEANSGVRYYHAIGEGYVKL